VHYADVPHGLLWVALVAPAGMFAAAVITRRLAPGGSSTSPAAAIPALALALALLVPAVTTVSNQLSREVEARADSFSLELTRSPAAFVGFERRLALRNVNDPDPPAWRLALLATHPSTLDRIGLAVAYERGSRAGR
jgi:STE24 endopeptidase